MKHAFLMTLIIGMVVCCFLEHGEAGVVVEKIDDRTARVTTTTEVVSVEEKTLAEIDWKIADRIRHKGGVNTLRDAELAVLDAEIAVLNKEKADAIKAEVMTQQEWEAAQPEPEPVEEGEGE